MSNNVELKKTISQRVLAFASQPLRQAALKLFEGLGYTSDRTLETRYGDDIGDQIELWI